MSRIEEALRRASEVDREPAAPEYPAESGPSTNVLQYPMDAADLDLFIPQEIAAAAPTEVDRTDLASAVVPPADDRRSAAKAPVTRSPGASEKLVVSDVVEPAAVEQYRKLAAALHHVQIERGTKIVMVSSAMPGEGKTLTAANLALTLSESFQRRVLLIDADLRRPTVHELFQIPNVTGLNDALIAAHDRKLSLVEVTTKLTVLPAGRPNPDPMRGLTSERMREIVEEAAAKYEWVVLDTPPIGLLPDANLLAEMVDMVVFVIGAGSTPVDVIQRAVKAMDRSRIVGVVLNRALESSATDQYYNYYHDSR